MRCIALDWSGASDKAAQKRTIWLAEAINGQLVRLENGRTRGEVVMLLVEEIQTYKDIVVGLDFAFSFPEWYLRMYGLVSVRALWGLAGKEGETWLNGDTWPFWGRPGRYSSRPLDLEPHCRFRQTEAALKVQGLQPKSVFQVNGAGAVGTGSIRGLPWLVNLQDVGATIWPFDTPKHPMVVEIWPRLLTEDVVKSSPLARAEYLGRRYPELNTQCVRAMEKSEDAFDAGVSALVMAAHAENFLSMSQATEPTKSLEGETWRP